MEHNHENEQDQDGATHPGSTSWRKLGPYTTEIHDRWMYDARSKVLAMSEDLYEELEAALLLDDYTPIVSPTTRRTNNALFTMIIDALVRGGEKSAVIFDKVSSKAKFGDGINFCCEAGEDSAAQPQFWNFADLVFWLLALAKGQREGAGKASAATPARRPRFSCRQQQRLPPLRVPAGHGGASRHQYHPKGLHGAPGDAAPPRLCRQQQQQQHGHDIIQ